MKTLVFAIAAVMVSGSMAFAAINDQSVSQQPVNEPDTTQVAQPEEPDSTAQTPETPAQTLSATQIKQLPRKR